MKVQKIQKIQIDVYLIQFNQNHKITSIKIYIILSILIQIVIIPYKLSAIIYQIPIQIYKDIYYKIKN